MAGLLAQLSPRVVWIGWSFDFSLQLASVESGKQEHVLQLIRFLLKCRSCSVTDLEHITGELLWISGLFRALRPTLTPLYVDQHRLSPVMCALTPDQWSRLRPKVSPDLTIQDSLGIACGARLLRVGQMSISFLSDVPVLPVESRRVWVQASAPRSPVRYGADAPRERCLRHLEAEVLAEASTEQHEDQNMQALLRQVQVRRCSLGRNNPSATSRSHHPLQLRLGRMELDAQALEKGAANAEVLEHLHAEEQRLSDETRNRSPGKYSAKSKRNSEQAEFEDVEKQRSEMLSLKAECSAASVLEEHPPKEVVEHELRNSLPPGHPALQGPNTCLCDFQHNVGGHHCHHVCRSQRCVLVLL
eukprot:s8692_g1.t1